MKFLNNETMKCIICGNHAGEEYEDAYVVLEDQSPYPAREVTYTGSAQEARARGVNVIAESQTKVIFCGCNEGEGRAPNETPQI